jgi:hypothetical protein
MTGLAGTPSMSAGRVAPSRRVRFAIAIAAAAIVLSGIRIVFLGGLSDFAPVWYGAHAILQGIDPYATFGPGRAQSYDWHLYYPVPAMLAALPFGLLPEPVASLLFSALGAGLLAFAVTRENWDRAWIFFSASFITAVQSSQWSPLMAAAFLTPALGFALICKPSLGSAIAVSTSSRKSIVVFLIGGAALTALSFVVLPGWLGEWVRAVKTGTELNPPISRGPGFLIALAILRWRQPEARLLLAVACVPQTSSWYETLLPMLAARTKREMQFMVACSGAGYLFQILMLDRKDEIATTDIGILMVVFVYLPALIVVLRRANEGPLPAWLRLRQPAIRTAAYVTLK